MKSIAKYFMWAFVAMTAGLFVTSCSSDSIVEDDVNNEVSNNDENLHELTVYLGGEKLSAKVAKMEGIATRSTLIDNGENKGITGLWSTTDLVKFFNITSGKTSYEQHYVLQPKTSGRVSELYGKVSCKAGDTFSLFYPHYLDNDGKEKFSVQGENYTNVVDFTLNITKQHGTLSDIASNFDYQYGVGEIHQDATTDQFYTEMDQVNSLMTICQFRFPDTTEIGHIQKVTIDNLVSGLTMHLNTDQDTDFTKMVEDKSTEQITIDSEDSLYFKDNKVYVALFPGTEVPSLTIYTDKGTYTRNYKKANFEMGKIYRIDVTSVH
jgi:hypothetical protein